MQFHFQILLIFIFSISINADKYYYNNNNNNNNTKFNNELTIDFPVGVLDNYTLGVASNITYNAEIRNNFSDVYTVTIPSIINKMYIGHSGGTYNAHMSRFLQFIMFESYGESYINYTIEIDCYNKTLWASEKNSDDDIDIIIIGGIIFGTFALFGIPVYLVIFFSKKCEKKHQYQSITTV